MLASLPPQTEDDIVSPLESDIFVFVFFILPIFILLAFCISILVFNTGYHYVVQAGLELKIFLSHVHVPRCWDALNMLWPAYACF